MSFRSAAAILAMSFSIAGTAAPTAPPMTPTVSPAEARAIAKEAYLYGNAFVDDYRILYSYFVDAKAPEYKGGWNQVHNLTRLYGPQDKAIQTINSDTLYSFIGMDLRTEPLVITVPRIETDKARYFSVQLIDLQGFNFDYIGTRTTGNGGGSFLIAGPGWKGETPKGVKKLASSETQLATAAFRTQLFDPNDLNGVKAVQAGYKVQTLSQYLGKPSPKAAPAIDFKAPLTRAEQKSAPAFYNVLDYTLQFAPVHPSEKELRARLAKLGIGAGKGFDVNQLSPELKAAMQQGMGDAWVELDDMQKKVNAGQLSVDDFFGSREFLKNNYLYRATAIVLGGNGHSKEEAIYRFVSLDSEGQKVDGSQRYTLRFAPGQMPPARQFWSLTMYELPGRTLVDNPIHRYLLNTPMQSQWVKDADGGVTFYLQAESPGKDNEANWLPAPQGPFYAVMRLYLPTAAAFDGSWKKPVLQKVAAAKP